MKRILNPLAALATLVIASSAVARPDEGYLLRRAPKEGDLDRYQIALNVSGQTPNGGPLSLDLTMVTADVVRKVDPDGSYQVATTVESGSGKMNGTEFKIPANGQAFTTTYDKSGRVLRRESGGGQGGNMAQILGMTRMGWAPERRVRAGEELKYDIPLGDPGSPQKLTGTITVVGIEKAGASVPVDALKVKNVGEMAVPGAGGSDKKLHLDITIYLSPEDARPLLTDGSLTNVHFGPLDGAKITFKVTRIDAAAPGK